MLESRDLTLKIFQRKILSLFCIFYLVNNFKRLNEIRKNLEGPRNNVHDIKIQDHTRSRLSSFYWKH